MRKVSMVLAGYVCGLGVAVAGAQGLPATSPTQPPLAAPTHQFEARPPAATPTAATAPQHRAQVQYAGRTLGVVADNSSLNQILREVGRVTGMKISGGVTEERVYGTYGPGDVSAVLAQLLGGTGSNMLLILDSRNQPSQLVLTPRQGGATPPGSGTGGTDQRRDDDDDLPPQLTQHVQRPPPPQPPSPPAQVPEAQTISPAVTDTPAPAAAATTTEESPNGVKTPQQIYDQLMKLQQQQVKKPSPQ